ncbi:hypothetical protein GCM10009606_19110 [Nocardioides aquiterrae]|uniref:Uncharacterized protein n=1 Tax=Nocardioides aquiterrae TaxID=203799 RepID=A0ABN1UF23_9ACTN
MDIKCSKDGVRSDHALVAITDAFQVTLDDASDVPRDQMRLVGLVHAQLGRCQVLRQTEAGSELRSND